MIAGTTGYSRKFIKDREEKMTNSLLYDLVNQMYAYSPDTPAPKDEIFQAESQAIQKLAEKENCVIIGRCSDFVLKDHSHCLRVFLGSSFKDRVEKLMQSNNLLKKKQNRKSGWKTGAAGIIIATIPGSPGDFLQTITFHWIPVLEPITV